jgi:DNA-binding winged helix-turn-helix (wHTH) protein
MNSGFVFGSFCLMPKQRLLLEAGQVVAIGSRALDILLALLERPGEVLAKDELMKRAWPTTTVGEDNLTVQISILRRILREGGVERCIVNVPGRGYVFTIAVDALPQVPAWAHDADKAHLAVRPRSSLQLVAAE